MSAQRVVAGVAGATGYAGMELARLLARHPQVAGLHLFAREQSESGGDLAQHYPELGGNGPLPLQRFGWEQVEAGGVEVLFLATPHEVSQAWAPEALRRGLRVVDLSGAWRLKRPEHRSVYGGNGDGAGEAAAQAVYGIPELHRAALSGSRLVANAGCYATSIILALAPLVHAGVLDPAAGIVCDAKSGVSGAGKAATPRTHFVAVAENLSAYSAFVHRHTGEILEQLRLQPAQLTFVPHLLPIPRGILSTIYVRLNAPATPEGVSAWYREFYAGCAWVRLFGAGRLPEIRHSLRTNYCDLGFELAGDGRRLVVVSCLDNLLKGAAGQAVQNMNAMFGWDERAGLA